jgi:tRNA(Glu) U13 pseudouridine synthase TruD
LFGILVLSKYKNVRDIIKYNDKQKDILTPYYFTEEEPKGDEDGKYKAIRIKFNLIKSAYATMCLRELTKATTSYSNQMQLNDLLNKLP